MQLSIKAGNPGGSWNKVKAQMRIDVNPEYLKTLTTVANEIKAQLETERYNEREVNGFLKTLIDEIVGGEN